MAEEIKVLTKDEWEKVLSGVTKQGQVHILEIEEPDPVPTDYLVAITASGAGKPATNYAGGIRLGECSSFTPASLAPSDYYMKPVGANGRIIILT